MNSFVQNYNAFFLGIGFKGYNNYWCNKMTNITVVFKLVKSRWDSDYYYIRLGVLLNELWNFNDRLSDESMWHFETSVSEFIEKKDLAKLSEIEFLFENPNHTHTIIEYIKSYILPYLENLDDLNFFIKNLDDFRYSIFYPRNKGLEFYEYSIKSQL